MSLFRRFRGPLAVVATLILSTSVAFAGEPASSAAGGLAKAATHSGKTVPVEATGDESADPAEDVEESEESGDVEGAEEDETTEESEGGENCATDPTGLTEEELAAMTHGSVVCWAAHQETPEGYANHGAWVSHWAKANKGHDNASSNGASHKGGNH